MALLTPENFSEHVLPLDQDRLQVGFADLTHDPKALLNLVVGFALYADDSEIELPPSALFSEEVLASDLEPRTTKPSENPSDEHMRHYLLMHAMQLNPKQGIDVAQDRIDRMAPHTVASFYGLLFRRDSQ
ncbi:MAG TPA: hypothetical protein VJR27_02700 [Candidatus Saccharimonadales bacterium]|nr:hypothetical protein [Candidatus Saccharimonadales bacterium]